MTVKTQDRDIASSTITVKDAITWAAIIVAIAGSYFMGKADDMVRDEKLRMVIEEMKEMRQESKDNQIRQTQILQDIQEDTQNANKRIIKYSEPDEEIITPRSARRR